MSIEFKGEGYHAKKPQKKDLVILDQKEQTDAKPRHSNVDREARLSVINNRMFIISILIVLVKFFAIYAQHAASVRADNTIKTTWVKMYSDGTWDVEFNDEKRQPDFFQATIGHILRNWSYVEDSFSKFKGV